MTTLEDVKTIDQRTKDFLNGYIRMIQDLFPTDKIYYTIPKLVTHWCLLYYFIRERFERYDKDNALISEDGRTATNHSIYSQSASIYGHVVIPYDTRLIHEWVFKCIRFEKRSLWAVGLDRAQSKSYCMQFYNMEGSYAFRASGNIENSQRVMRGAHSGWFADDEITLEFNGNSKLLSIKINDKPKEEQTIQVMRNSEGYRVVLYLGERGDRGQLLSYTEKKEQ